MAGRDLPAGCYSSTAWAVRSHGRPRGQDTDAVGWLDLCRRRCRRVDLVGWKVGEGWVEVRGRWGVRREGETGC